MSKGLAVVESSVGLRTAFARIRKTPALSAALWERRGSERRPGERAVKFLDLLSNRFHAGLLRNSSETGMLVRLAIPRPMQIGQRVRFVIAEGSFARRSSMRLARVVRVEQGDSGVDVGMQFIPEVL